MQNNHTCDNLKYMKNELLSAAAKEMGRLSRESQIRKYGGIEQYRKEMKRRSHLRKFKKPNYE